MRASRLLSILLTLRVRGQISAAELAETHEVTTRTIYRDIDELSAAGIPVYAVRGRRGGFRLADGFRSSLTALSRDEAAALSLAGLPDAAAELGLGGVLAAADLKLKSALPGELRDHTERIAERFLLDVPGWEARGESAPPLLPEMAEAVWSAQEMRLTYQRTGHREPVERVVAPLGLVLKAGNWYVVAAPSEQGLPVGDPRTYRVSRIATMAPTGASAQRPETFRLPKFWSEYQRSYEERLYSDRAVVRFGPRARALAFLLGRIPGRAVRAESPGPDGWTTASVPIESTEHAVHALLQLGDEVEVLAPPGLRQAIADTARAIAERYPTSPSGGADEVG